ncbi:9123_t:CDS:2 [Funneliformis geosporum]|uniref:9123_t:CDS:1 n=1 Tax=Funneliformis geosporum TaxID=1117311 RepID=A0A9W4WYQ2_9GLOM|nr:9123_t:CDS:2 [Funneliformis geosporum]
MEDKRLLKEEAGEEQLMQRSLICSGKTQDNFLFLIEQVSFIAVFRASMYIEPKSMALIPNGRFLRAEFVFPFSSMMLSLY